MSRSPGTTEKTMAGRGNQVSTTPGMTARRQSPSGDLPGYWSRRRTWQAVAGEGATGACPKVRRCGSCRRIGGNLVSTVARASTPQAWKPGFHGVWRRRTLPLDAGAVSVRRTGGDQVPTTLALTAQWRCFIGDVSTHWWRNGSWRAAEREGASAVCPETSQSATHRRNGGNQVSTVARASTPRAWKPSFHGAWHTRFSRIDTGVRSARRNVGGNQVSTPMEIQHG